MIEQSDEMQLQLKVVGLEDDEGNVEDFMKLSLVSEDQSASIYMTFEQVQQLKQGLVLGAMGMDAAAELAESPEPERVLH